MVRLLTFHLISNKRTKERTGSKYLNFILMYVKI